MRRVPLKRPKRSAWEAILAQQIKHALLPEPAPEYRFHPERRWRFDLAWPSCSVALEIEGGIWTGGRHTRGAGFVADVLKYNEATMLGWRVYRCTPADVRSGAALALVRKILLPFLVTR